MTLDQFRELAKRLISLRYGSRRAFIRAVVPASKENSAQGYLSRVLSGKKPPPLDVLEAWATALDLTGEARDRFIWLGQLANAPEVVRKRVATMESELAKRTHLAGNEADAVSGSDLAITGGHRSRKPLRSMQPIEPPGA